MPLVGFLATVALTIGPGVAPASPSRCSAGRWTIDGGPVMLGPFAFDVVGLRDGVPVLNESCRAQRWVLAHVDGETRLRALFLCRPPDATRRFQNVPLRLRARIFDACAHMEGAIGSRRLGVFVRFMATRLDGECASNDDCAAEAFCRHPAGECAATGVCAQRPSTCFGTPSIVCGCDGRTYGYCDAAQAGVSVAYLGPCGETCGGIAGTPCPDGKYCELPAGECGSADLQGRCQEIPTVCPELYAPACGCDGVTYDNDCFRRQAGAQRAHLGTCADCLTDAQCASDAYCAKAPGHCDARGACTPRPLGCPDNVDPVCGCDRATYFNACEAAAAGVSVAYPGECRGICGGLAGIPCPANEFCEFPPDTCSVVDLQGRCVEVGDACPEFYSPVCGCDGVTYANDCFRQAARAQKSHDGPCECVPKTAPCARTCDCYAQLGTAFCDDCPLLCPNCGDFWQCKDGGCVEQCGVIPPDVQTCSEAPCGGIAGIPCPTGQVCELPAGLCDSADLQGRCVPTGLCTQQYDPVCGCDGKTYPNDCERLSAGVQKAHDGACDATACPCVCGDGGCSCACPGR